MAKKVDKSKSVDNTEPEQVPIPVKKVRVIKKQLGRPKRYSESIDVHSMRMTQSLFLWLKTHRFMLEELIRCDDYEISGEKDGVIIVHLKK